MRIEAFRGFRIERCALAVPSNIAASCKMNECMSHLPQDLERLSAAEKVELLDALWESLESDLPAFSAEQRGELDYREGRYRENPAGVLPWEQIKTDLLKKR